MVAIDGVNFTLILREDTDGPVRLVNQVASKKSEDSSFSSSTKAFLSNFDVSIGDEELRNMLDPLDNTKVVLNKSRDEVGEKETVRWELLSMMQFTRQGRRKVIPKERALLSSYLNIPFLLFLVKSS